MVFRRMEEDFHTPCTRFSLLGKYVIGITTLGFEMEQQTEEKIQKDKFNVFR
jgi:hypothetical protein